MQYNLIITTVTIVYIDLSQQRQFLPPAPIENDILKKLLYEEMPIDLKEKKNPKKGKRKGKSATHLKKTNKQQDTDNEVNENLLFDEDNMAILWNILNEDDKEKNKSERPFKYKAKHISGLLNSDADDGSNVKQLLKRLRAIDQEKRKTEALLKKAKINKDFETPNRASEAASKEAVKTNFINELTDMIAEKIVRKYQADDDDTESVEKIDILLGSDMEINVDSVLPKSTSIILV